ncbi:MAG: fructosamine kinase family protein [Myxococcales bacterium]|nr:fructosamine kinase family protein [Myxococcales bacterium]
MVLERGGHAARASRSEALPRRPLADRVRGSRRAGARLSRARVHRAREPPKGYETALAIGLAELHAAMQDRFGFAVDTYCGRTLQPNPWTDSWIDFYREHRILHQVRSMVDARRVAAREVRVFERLAARLDGLLEPGPAALIHGDLWSQNHFADTEGRPVIFDPAGYCGHAEAELGMMTLFGGFTSELYGAYMDARGVDKGWRERNPLYQLYHVMNHATLFGGSYVDQAFEIARRFA